MPIYNPSNCGGRDLENGGLRLGGGKSSQDPISANKPCMMVYTCHSSYIGSTNRRTAVQAGWGINYRP
jgi:hypothetical protein